MSSYYATASAYAPPILFGKKADAVTQTFRITHDYNLHGIGRLRDKSLPMHISATADTDKNATDLYNVKKCPAYA